MWKMLGLLVIGLAVGGGIWYANRDQPAPRSLLVSTGDAQGVDVQRSLAALDQRVRDLTAQVRALQGSSGRPAAGADGGKPGDPAAANFQRGRQNRSPEDMAAMREQMEKRDAERIKAAGLTPERMKDINRRAEELRVAAMQAQYEAQRTGQPARGGGQDINQSLRKELGDAEYERYLKASGQPTQVQVMEVLATSVAERSGIKTGDEIVSYNGKRVFDNRDLNNLATANTGGAVTVEVKRDGQTVQLSVPAGPLGITGGGGGGPGGRGGGGPPGGFGGGGGGPPGGFGGGGGGGGRGGNRP